MDEQPYLAEGSLPMAEELELDVLRPFQPKPFYDKISYCVTLSSTFMPWTESIALGFLSIIVLAFIFF